MCYDSGKLVKDTYKDIRGIAYGAKKIFMLLKVHLYEINLSDNSYKQHVMHQRWSLIASNDRFIFLVEIPQGDTSVLYVYRTRVNFIIL